eukprot:3114084-Pyramimonas_sp.AAC.1
MQKSLRVDQAPPCPLLTVSGVYHQVSRCEPRAAHNSHDAHSNVLGAIASQGERNPSYRRGFDVRAAPGARGSRLQRDRCGTLIMMVLSQMGRVIRRAEVLCALFYCAGFLFYTYGHARKPKCDGSVFRNKPSCNGLCVGVDGGAEGLFVWLSSDTWEPRGIMLNGPAYLLTMGFTVLATFSKEHGITLPVRVCLHYSVRTTVFALL